MPAEVLVALEKTAPPLWRHEVQSPDLPAPSMSASLAGHGAGWVHVAVVDESTDRQVDNPGGG
jgi:hypothetical protein